VVDYNEFHNISQSDCNVLEKIRHNVGQLQWVNITGSATAEGPRDAP